MKTPPAKQARLPKTELVKAGFLTTHISAKQDRAVIYCPTQKAARALVKMGPFLSLPRKAQLEWIAAQLFHPLADYTRANNPNQVKLEQADAILRALSKHPSAILELMEGKQ